MRMLAVTEEPMAARRPYPQMASTLEPFHAPMGIRTPVSALKGPRPSPLDDRGGAHRKDSMLPPFSQDDVLRPRLPAARLKNAQRPAASAVRALQCRLGAETRSASRRFPFNCLEIGEQEVVVVVVDPQETQDRRVVGRVEPCAQRAPRIEDTNRHVHDHAKQQ